MPSGQLLMWLKRKLAEVGVQKVVPEHDVLAKAYRRGLRLAEMERQMAELDLPGDDEMPVPDDLEVLVRERLAARPELAWDDVVFDLARQSLSA